SLCRAAAPALFPYTTRFRSFGPPVVGFMSDRFADAGFGGGFEAACPGGVAPRDAAQALVESCAAASAFGIQRALIVTMGVFFVRSEEHTSELQSRENLVCRL